MGVRGPASGAELLSFRPGRSVQRPPPPPELGAKAKREWIAIVERMPADWFPRETHPMLTQLCRLIESADAIDRKMRARGLEHGEFSALFKMQREVSSAIGNLSTKMR